MKNKDKQVENEFSMDDLSYFRDTEGNVTNVSADKDAEKEFLEGLKGIVAQWLLYRDR